MSEDSERGSTEKLTMYNPKELEGEVDHSFFDSDGDASGSQSEKPIHHHQEEEEEEQEDKDSTNEQLPDQSECSQIERRGKLIKEKAGLESPSGFDLKGGSDRKGQTRIKASDKKKKDHDQTGEGKDDSDASLYSRSDMSSPSDLSSSGDSEVADGARKSKDGRRRSGPAKRSGRKLLSLLRRRSSSSSSKERSPTPAPHPGSADPKQRLQTVESDDTVTDVTPLSSPDTSPQQTLSMALLAYTDRTSPVLRPGSATDIAWRRIRTARNNPVAVVSVGRQMDSVLLVSNPGGRTTGSGRRKNYSFNSDEVRRIERENQRLLQELSRSSACFSYRSSRRASVPSPRLYHSGLNRLRDQERIQRENLAFLKRLESVKATPGMTRTEQLTDYQRQAGYLRAPTCRVRPTSGRTSKSCNSASPHRARSESANATSSPALRPAKDLMV